jgi:phosphatidylglycerol lysyltransferase
MFRFAHPALPPLTEATGAARDRVLASAPQAEWGLAHQGAEILLTSDQGSGWLVRHAGCSLVALGLPFGPACLRQLTRTARVQGKMPLLYKCDQHTALKARREGWRVIRLGHEVILDLAGWSLERPARRQLRRKLRASEKAGVEVRADAELPIAQMERVALEWSSRHGGEKGFSMGRFERGYVGKQHVLLAWVGQRLVGFATFHATRAEWTLDLMRHVETAPDGTMHRLIAEAVTMARNAGAKRLSLAGIPDPLPSPARLPQRINPSCGLAQFKRSFGPRLAPRYAAAPGWTSLTLGLAAVTRAIHWPEPIDRRAGSSWALSSKQCLRRRSLETQPSAPHYWFEPAPAACDARSVKLRSVPMLMSGRRPPS